jgi:CBS domain-containing protein
MTSDVYTVSPETPISEVADLLFSHSFHGVPVVKKDKLVGIITEDDFFLKNYDGLFLPSYIKFLKDNKNTKALPKKIQDKIRKLLKIKAEDIMTTRCQTVSPETDAEELMNIIKETKFTTFPVISTEKKCVGIVTLSDVLGTVKRGTREMGKLLEKENKKNELYKLTSDINDFWQNKIVMVSKKRVRTWKGGFIIAVSAVILVSAFLFSIIDSQKNCGLADTDLLPIECQKFNYSEWSECDANGIQKRSVLSKLPSGCEGGSPVMTQPCQ